jgi:hypothetical protein
MPPKHRFPSGLAHLVIHRKKLGEPSAVIPTPTKPLKHIKPETNMLAKSMKATIVAAIAVLAMSPAAAGQDTLRVVVMTSENSFAPMVDNNTATDFTGTHSTTRSSNQSKRITKSR